MRFIAVLDTETNWGDEVMSIGIVKANADNFVLKESKYFILDLEYRRNGMYSDELFLKGQNHDLGTYDILLYDNVPGGAGHVKRLVDKDAILKSLGAAREKVTQKCCDQGTSCCNCLRNYNNQKYHELLTRQYALEIIEEIIAGINYQ